MTNIKSIAALADDNPVTYVWSLNHVFEVSNRPVVVYVDIKPAHYIAHILDHNAALTARSRDR